MNTSTKLLFKLLVPALFHFMGNIRDVVGNKSDFVIKIQINVQCNTFLMPQHGLGFSWSSVVDENIFGIECKLQNFSLKLEFQRVLQKNIAV